MRRAAALLLLALVSCDSPRTVVPGTPSARDGSTSTVDGSVASDGGAPAPDAAAVDCTGVMPVSGLAARCCPDFGVDACGPGLFCAAFDGRSFPACYADHARLDGESCTDDRHCLSYRCSADAQVCRSSPGASCTTALGCGPGPSMSTVVCAGGTCRPSTGNTGAPCGLGTDCATGFCVASVCSAGAEDDPCAAPTDCLSGRCTAGACSSGGEGSTCASPGDCVSGRCVNRQCSSGSEGSNCVRGTDCASNICVARSCSAGTNGRACVRATDCAAGLHCVRPCPAGQSCTSECSDGAIDSPCSANADCSGSTCAREIDGNWKCGGTCTGSGSCSDGFVCSGARSCVPAGAMPESAACTMDADCASAVCADFGAGGTLCSGPAGYWSPCNGNNCAAELWCETRSGSPGAGRCLPAEGAACRRFHDSVEIWTATCHSAIGRCGRYLHARCEGTTTSCRVDADCGAARCIVSHGCGF